MSEKPSDTSTLPPRDDTPSLLLDENLSSADIPEMLRRIRKEWRIEQHLDHFRPGTADPEVIAECGRRRWALVSCDDRIRYVPQNKAAVIKHGVHAFMFGKGNYQGVEYAAALIVGRGQMLNMIRRTAGYFFAHVRRSGEIVLMEPRPNKATEASREKTIRKYGDHIWELHT